ncbi:MAG: Spermidine synthase [Labilithrix sp.]|nr:Spermidine synthase [Labilithrix sp.]
MRAWIYAVFLLSGFAALLYQIVWQRALYAIYGINVESVTMVVTAFMLGLGLGSIAGGIVSKDKRRPVLLMFSLVELGIGIFGAVSLAVFHAVGEVTLGMSALGTFFVTFLLVLVPTLLMGSTLPLLVAHLVRSSGNVGKSVGTLYFVNTLGSAFASAAAVLFILGRAGQTGSVRLAALLNVTVSLLAYVAHRRSQRPGEIAAALGVLTPHASETSSAEVDA